jgi:hypothetical protein
MLREQHIMYISLVLLTSLPFVVNLHIFHSIAMYFYLHLKTYIFHFYNQ